MSNLNTANIIKSQINPTVLMCSGAHDFKGYAPTDKHNGALAFNIQNTSKYKKAIVTIMLTYSDEYTIKIHSKDYEELDTQENVHAPELAYVLEALWETTETLNQWETV
tara:strand:+ start:575 stop:901 length:327 start_codon:yes stop_codon:yes gene_type:complete